MRYLYLTGLQRFIAQLKQLLRAPVRAVKLRQQTPLEAFGLGDITRTELEQILRQQAAAAK